MESAVLYSIQVSSIDLSAQMKENLLELSMLKWKSVVL